MDTIHKIHNRIHRFKLRICSRIHPSHKLTPESKLLGGAELGQAANSAESSLALLVKIQIKAKQKS